MKLLVLAASLVVAHCFLQPTHFCGDSQSRLHLRNSCKYSLHQLDSLVPDVDAALDEHNRRNFQEVLQHPETDMARKAVQNCFSCVLAGGIGCDQKPRDTGDQSLHRVTRDWHGAQTGLSQNCLDHVAAQRRIKQGTKLFKDADLHVHDSMSLMEAPIVASKPRILLDIPTDVSPTATSPSISADANDVTLNHQAVGTVYDSMESSSNVHSTTAVVEANRRELSEPVRDTFICAQIDNTFTGELVCPDGQRITAIEFASYGTPSDQDYKLDANVTDTEFLTKRTGVKIFKGERCFNIDYASRSDCNAYDSRELVDRVCHGATRCTLSAIGDKRRLMAFQPLVCDLKLKLYVKARCAKAAVTNALGQSTLAAKELSMMGVDVDDVHRSVELDFSNPDHADFIPASLPVVSLAEIENGARPIVRAPIDPPPEFYNAFALKGEGRVCYKCAFTGVTDEDGMVYYWRACDEDPQLSFVNLSPLSGNDVVATWNGDRNTYQNVNDGSFLKPDAVPTGLVTDYSVDQTSKTPVVNAPDFLYHVVSGSSSGQFANVHYIQRFQTTNGMPPNSNGQIVINGITYNKCNAAQARDNIAAEVPISATYVFYKERSSAAAPAPSGVPAWAVLLIVCGALLVITLIILGVMGKLPNLRQHRQQSDVEEEHLEETLADEEAGEELEERL